MDAPPGYPDLASIGNLQDVIAWLTERGVSPPFVAMIAQDEYTHDLVARLAADQYLAFDATGKFRSRTNVILARPTSRAPTVSGWAKKQRRGGQIRPREERSDELVRL